MATIRPSIYIGLGGTGILAISKTKKMYEEAYEDNIPSQVAFIAIDFDSSVKNDTNLATSIEDNFLQLKNIGNPKELYDERMKLGDFKWMFPSNSNFIGTKVSDGASQVRTYGRFLTEMIKDSILKRIKTTYIQVKNIENEQTKEQEDQVIDVHIAMSLAGGTGCGSFLNIADLIRSEYGDKVNIIGYGVIHGVFRTMDPSTTKSPRVVANAYSAILDLDYLMDAASNNPIEISLNGKTKKISQSIYDEFYVIDNETENGKIVREISKLCEVLGTCLFVAGSTLGDKIKSGSSNTKWKNGDYNITPKRGWVQSLGACQVVYKGELLSKIYGFKAAIEIIRKLQNSSADIQQEALNWTEIAKIREDGDQNNLMIDSIYAPANLLKTKEPLLDTRDSITTIKNVVNNYLNILPEDFPTDKKNEIKTAEIIKNLQEKFNSLLNAENGVGNSLGFIYSLEKLLNQFKNEMESEASVYDKRANEALGLLVGTKYTEFEDYLKKWFKSASKKEEAISELIGRPAQKILKDKLELARRKSASLIFTNLITVVSDLKERTEQINKKLINLNNQYSETLSSLINTSESSLVFEYDLSYEEKIHVNVNSNDVLVDDYIASLNKSLSEVELQKDLDSTLKEYVHNLKKADEYRKKLIVDVIDGLGENEYTKLKNEISEKSSRLLTLDHRSQIITTRNGGFATDLMTKNYLISYHPQKDETGKSLSIKLEKDTAFLQSHLIDKVFLSSDSSFMKQKMIFYRRDAAIIPYCIGSFDENTIEKEYNSLILDAVRQNSTSFNPHFDKGLFTEMKNKDFKLKPELQNEAMLYWICGNLFGWQTIKEEKYIMQKDNNGNPLKIEKKEEVENIKYIRINKGKYYVWNEDGESKGMDGKWTTINNAAQRDLAFSLFKTGMLPEIKETLHAKIKDDIAKKGKGYFDAIIENVINGGKFDYIDSLVCADKSSLTYYQQAKGEDKQFDEEWQYIVKFLKNALSSI